MVCFESSIPATKGHIQVSKGNKTLSGIKAIDGPKSSKNHRSGRGSVHFASITIEATKLDDGTFALDKKVNRRTLVFGTKALNAALQNTSEVVSIKTIETDTGLTVKLYTREYPRTLQARIAKANKFREKFLDAIGQPTAAAATKVPAMSSAKRESARARSKHNPAR